MEANEHLAEATNAEQTQESTKNSSHLILPPRLTSQDNLDRRGFIKTISIAGAGLALGDAAARAGGPIASDFQPVVKEVIAQAPKAMAKPAVKTPPKPAPKTPPKAKNPELKVAFIGPGVQGRNLLTQCLRIEGVRFVAVCDIWDYSLTYAANILKKFDQPVRTYTDYHDLLEKEKDLDAVIIATPDWMHSPITVACLEAGLHVYCEKEMSNDIEEARKMVLAQRKSGKLLQIGHQRRSNPRYWAVNNLLHKDKLAGDLTHVFGQWNRSRKLDLGWPKDAVMSDADLKRHGYDSMQRFRNWRWYRKFSGGPIADLGSHQVDIFNWFLGGGPTAVQATGGADNYKDTEWYDNMLTLWDYQTPTGPVRGFYQVINTSSYGGYYEVFMGKDAAIEISENINKGAIFREPQAKPRVWENEAKQVEKDGVIGTLVIVGKSLDNKSKTGPGDKLSTPDVDKPPHLLHLENFFNAIWDPKNNKLSCPGEVGFETCVTVLKANQALKQGSKVTYDPKEFEV